MQTSKIGKSNQYFNLLCHIANLKENRLAKNIKINIIYKIILHIII